jgi:secreted PhoX family phosphatase
MKSLIPLILSFFLSMHCYAQQKHISEFESPSGLGQDDNFNLPNTHSFQILIKHEDLLTQGGKMPDNLDFAGYVPREGSSTSGYLSVNSESIPKGAVTILDIEFDDVLGKWMVDKSQAVDFSFELPAELLVDVNGNNLGIGSTVANCSGTVTPWNTIITCEEWTNKDVIKKLPTLDESLIKVDGDINGYDAYGWAIEIDPATKTVIDQDDSRPGPDKLLAMGNFKHENAVIHANL